MVKTEKKKKTYSYWLSWYCPSKLMGKFKLNWPWWIAGYGANDEYIICAAIKAPSKYEAIKTVVDAHDDPEPDIRWRFTERRPKSWSPFNSRFKRADWMKW